MINTTDFQEVEVLLPGDWCREDNGDIYSFTVEKMEISDDRLFRQLLIRHADADAAGDPGATAAVDTSSWALMIKDDYCGIIIGADEYIIKEIGGNKMVWEDDGKKFAFFKAPCGNKAL